MVAQLRELLIGAEIPPAAETTAGGKTRGQKSNPSLIYLRLIECLYLVTSDDLWETYKYKIEQTGGGRQLRLASEKTGTAWKEVR